MPRSQQPEVTPLSAADELKFRAWVQKNGITDLDDPQSRYDYRGYWKDVASKGQDQRKTYDDGPHFPDTYKQHGHPTFSVESKYSTGPNDGGRWNGETYVPQQTPYTPTVDPLEAALRRAPISDDQRADLWDLYAGASSGKDLRGKLDALKVPASVKLQLFHLKSQETAKAPTISTPSQPEGSAIGRFVSNAWDVANPVNIASGVYNAVRHPIDTASNLASAQVDQYRKAKQADAEGRTSEMVGHSIAAAIPVLGPMAAEAGEQIATGDVAGGLGKGAALVASVPLTAAATSKVARVIPKDAAKAARLESEAQNIVSQKVLAPRNPKYKVPASKAAGELLKRGVQGDRYQVEQWAKDLADDATQRIDDAIAQYPASATIDTAPIVAEMDDALQKMTFIGPNGIGINPEMQPLFDKMKAQRDFISARGPKMTFEDMRRMRSELDDKSIEAGRMSKPSGDPSLSDTAKATGLAADATRRQIAAERPELAVPNADYHLARTVLDVLDPNKGRPAGPPSATTGATGGLHTTGAVIGSAVSNVPGLRAIGAFIASDLLPRIREAKVSPKNQLRLANDMHKLAEQLKTGNTSAAKKTLVNFSLYVPGFNGARLTTEPASQGASR